MREDLEDRVKDLERRMNTAEDMVRDLDHRSQLRSADGLPLEAATQSTGSSRKPKK
jgi:hypothetical protein